MICRARSSSSSRSAARARSPASSSASALRVARSAASSLSSCASRIRSWSDTPSGPAAGAEGLLPAWGFGATAPLRRARSSGLGNRDGVASGPVAGVASGPAERSTGPSVAPTCPGAGCPHLSGRGRPHLSGRGRPHLSGCKRPRRPGCGHGRRSRRQHRGAWLVEGGWPRRLRLGQPQPRRTAGQQARRGFRRLLVVDVVEPQHRRIGADEPAGDHLADGEQAGEAVTGVAGDGLPGHLDRQAGQQPYGHGLVGDGGDVGEHHVADPVRPGHRHGRVGGQNAAELLTQVEPHGDRVVTAGDGLSLDQQPVQRHPRQGELFPDGRQRGVVEGDHRAGADDAEHLAAAYPGSWRGARLQQPRGQRRLQGVVDEVFGDAGPVLRRVREAQSAAGGFADPVVVDRIDASRSAVDLGHLRHRDRERPGDVAGGHHHHLGEVADILLDLLRVGEGLLLTGRHGHHHDRPAPPGQRQPAGERLRLGLGADGADLRRGHGGGRCVEVRLPHVMTCFRQRRASCPSVDRSEQCTRYGVDGRVVTTGSTADPRRSAVIRQVRRPNRLIRAVRTS